MLVVLVFAVLLLVSVLVSELAARSVLSTAVVFLLGGFVAGEGVLGILHFTPDSPVESRLAELALFAVLFTDGMHLRLEELRSSWKLPGRALLLGMPLFFGVTAALGHWWVGLDWISAGLVAAVLSPTDPVLAAAILGRERIPQRLRRLLNVESGLNDGLALPLVVALLAAAGARSTSALALGAELLAGVALGVALTWGAARTARLPYFSISGVYGPLFAFAVGLLVLAITALIHANEFLAAFAAGVTMASVHPDMRAQFRAFGEIVAELLKLAAILVFGALILPAAMGELDARDYVFAALVLLAVRPATLLPALIGSGLPLRERVVAAWFGPKGFASVTFGLMIYRSRIADSEHLFHVVALAVAASIVLHSSTDVLFARWFREGQESRASA